MLLMGAFMLGMECLNTLVSQSRISALSGQVQDIRDRQDNIIALITQDETQIKNNHENLEIVRRVIELKEEEDKWYNLGAAVNIVVEEFLNDIELTEELLGAALDKKLHPRLINETIAKEKLLEVSKYASMRGMQVLVDTPIQLLQLNAGFLTDNDLLFLVIHVPIARPEYIFNLKRYVGMPVRLSDESMAWVTDPEGATFLGWPMPRGENFYVTLTTAELSRCQRMNGNYFCENVNKFDHIDNPSCLQALYESDKENVMSKCTIHVTKSHLVVKQLLDNTFAIFNETMTPFSIECPEKPHHSYKGNFDKSRSLSVDEGCYALVGPHKLVTRPHSAKWYTKSNQFDWSIDLGDILPGTDHDSFHALMDEWQHVGPVPRQLLMTHIRNSNLGCSTVAWIGIAASFGTNAMVIFCFCWSYNRTKRNNDTIVDSGKKSGTTNNIYVGKSPSEIDTQEEGRTEEHSDKRH